MRKETLGRWVKAGLFRRFRLGVPRALAVGCLLMSAAAARAEAPELALAPPPAAATVERAAPVLLVVHGSLDTAKLVGLLEAELGREVVVGDAPGSGAVFGVLTVAHRPDAKEMAVTWERAGQTLTRLVAAPADASAVESDAALLAGNLAREQVATLLPAAPELAPPVPPVAPPSPAPPPAPEHRGATFGIFYPLATHHGHAEVTSSFDLNLFYSRVGSIDGAQLGGVNVVARDAGSAPSSMRGLELGFLANLVAGDVRGVQGAGLFNQATGSVEGLQLAAGANLAAGSVQGLQSAFLFNRSARMKGVQVALVNVAGDVDGVQIGLVNVAGRMRGASVGLVNVADDVEGLPLAPFSVTRTGGVHPATWGGSGGFGNLGIKLATRHTYTLFFGSYHRKYGLDLFGGGFAIGGSVALGAGFRSDFDASGTYLIAPELSTDPSRVSGYHEQLLQPRLRWMIALRLAEHFGLFGGVAALGNIRSELGWDRVTATIGPEVFGGVEL